MNAWVWQTFLAALQLLLIWMKLVGEIAWGWGWVLLPLWGPPAVMFVVLGAFFGIGYWNFRQRRRRERR